MSEETPETPTVSPRASIRDYGFPLGLSLLLLISCVVYSAKKPYWSDELLTYYLAMDRQFGHMYAALKDTFNTSPPLYHVLAWIWAGLFGGSPLALRLLTALAFCGAYWVLWGVLKRRFGRLPAALGLALTLPTSLFQPQIAEARNYGLYLLCCSLTVGCFDRAIDNPKSDFRLPVLNFLAHAALIATHAFGLIYSGILLAFTIVLDLSQRRFNLKLYASTLFAWLLFALLWLPTLKKQTSDFTPYSWVGLPGIRDLFWSFFLYDKRIFVVLMLLFGAVLLRWLTSRRVALTVQNPRPEKALAILAVLFILIPGIVIYYVSHHGTSVFVGRYFMPSLIGWSILLSYLLQLVYARSPRTEASPEPLKPERPPLQPLFGLLLTGVLLFALALPFRQPSVSPNEVCIDTARLPPGIPVVFNDFQDYLANCYYSNEKSRIFFMQDLEAAKNSSPGGPSYKIGNRVVGVVMAEGLKRHYPDFNIVPIDLFFKANERFLVVSRPGNDWAEARLLSNPDYICRPIQAGSDPLLLVEKQHGP